MKLSIKSPVFFEGVIDPYDISRLESWVSQLEHSNPQTLEELELFLKKIDELNHKINDTGAQIYIKSTCDTSDKKILEDYNAFQQNIIGYYAAKDFAFKKIILNSPALSEWINTHSTTGVLLEKIMRNSYELFREENIPLSIKESELGIEYRTIVGGMSVEFNGEEKTLPELAVYLHEKDRSIRESAWRARNIKMMEHKDQLNKLFDQLFDIRQEMAKNAGFKNFRDLTHQAKGRFSYTVEDIHAFHDAVHEEIMPLIAELNKKRKNTLKLDTLRPWDMAVSLDGKILKPVKDPKDLVPKHITMMTKTDPLFGQNFTSMRDTDLLDLFNRKNKAPGGYSYPLYQYGASFIFMNAVGMHSDLITLVHEIGHAMHEFAQAKHQYTSLLGLPMEAAELASMSMEMLTMDHWNECYDDPADFKKAKYDQIAGALKFFPWCMIVDKFQQQIYTVANTAEKREQAFLEIMKQFSDKAGLDWSGLEEQKAIQWLFQLHIFEVPFYYIEYGIAQLGALAVYREYKKDKHRALENYKNFLNAGHQKPLAELYHIAGIELKFTKEYIRDLVSFIKEELETLN
ncbi:MAG: M3 family oligoendopeptidase [Brevinema sp.]